MLSIKLSIFFIIVPFSSLGLSIICHEYIFSLSHESIKVLHNRRFFVLLFKIIVWEKKWLSIWDKCKSDSLCFQCVLYFYKVLIDIVLNWSDENKFWYIMFFCVFSYPWYKALFFIKFCYFSFLLQSMYNLFSSSVIYDFWVYIKT